jgi:hypothetical protein
MQGLGITLCLVDSTILSRTGKKDSLQHHPIDDNSLELRTFLLYINSIGIYKFRRLFGCGAKRNPATSWLLPDAAIPPAYQRPRERATIPSSMLQSFAPP